MKKKSIFERIVNEKETNHIAKKLVSKVLGKKTTQLEEEKRKNDKLTKSLFRSSTKNPEKISSQLL